MHLRVELGPMQIAMLGTRGVPASYSGFETCVEQLGARLVERGHQVTVYCRSHHITYRDPYYRGMRLVRLPTIPNKYLDTYVHTLLSSVHASRFPYDIALYFIVGNSPLTVIPRLRGVASILNVDGLDWKRSKWPKWAQKYIRLSERIATWAPNAVITDSRVIQRYYQERYHYKTTYIPYGSELDLVAPGPMLARYGLVRGEYFLFVGRLVPENCTHHLVHAFRGLKTEKKCVIIGDAPYAEKYIRELKAVDDPRVVFTGYQFGEGYRELLSNAYAFVETSEAGGTHPALVEAMALGNCVVVNDTAENQETIGDAGLCYEGARGGDALRPILAQLLADAACVAEYGARAQARAHSSFSWDQVTTAYEALFFRMKRRPQAENSWL